MNSEIIMRPLDPNNSFEERYGNAASALLMKWGLLVGIHSLRNQTEDGDGAHEEDCVVELDVKLAVHSSL